MSQDGPPEYLDFDLKIERGTPPYYPVSVVRSPMGEAREEMRFPFSDVALENQLLAVENALLRGGNRRRKTLSAVEEEVQGFGKALFDCLFTGEIASLYRESLREAAREGKGLRLRLCIQPPTLARLPWELLYDGRIKEYLCLSRNTPLVRYLELAQPIQPLPVRAPLRILGMVANPVNLEPLDVAVEKQRVERAVQELQRDGLVELHWLPGQTWRDLQRAMRRGPWHIFHFIGHGGFDSYQDEGVILLANRQGEAAPLNATQLGRMLADHRSLQLVLLNSCEGGKGSQQDLFSSTAATLVQRGLSAVLSMQHEISDLAGIEFAQSFYEALADAMPVDAAVTEARKAISFASHTSLEWGTPMLHMRSADGRLFEPDVDGRGEQESSGKGPAQTFSNDNLSGPFPEDGSIQPPSSVESKAHRSDTKIETPKIIAPKPPIEFDWVTIPAGEFLMGGGRYEDEKPQHSVYLPEYWIARVPVTNAQYKVFVEATHHQVPDHWEDGKIPQDKENHPVVWVSWHDVQAFCAWAKVRLPTEAEWEKAARGTDGQSYPWGEEEPNQRLLNYDMNVGDTTAAGHYPNGVSPYGLLDMAGNVWEWTNTLYQDYPYQSDDGREDAQAVGGRVLRGGSFNSNPSLMRATNRVYSNPFSQYYDVGVRVVAAPSL